MTTIESFPDIQHSLLAHRRGSWARRIPALAAVVLVAGACSTGGTSSASAPTSTAAASASAEAPSASVEPESGGLGADRADHVRGSVRGGGPTDTVTRLVAEPMSATLGQQLVFRTSPEPAARRGRPGGRGGAGRLHGPDAPHRDVDRADAVSGPAVRSAYGLQDDRACHRGPDDDRRAAAISNRPRSRSSSSTSRRTPRR